MAGLPTLRAVRALALLATLSAAGCGDDPTAHEAPRDDAPPPHLVLVTLDTTRADHLGCYGYPRNTTPFLDRLAEEGVLFERAYATMSTTSPSHASLFTSLYPLQHGVLRNGQRLAASFRTAAEVLQERGYRTAAFVSTAAHFRDGGMEQGFDVFDDPKPEDGPYRIGSDTATHAIEWLRTAPADRPLFLWLHLFDPHLPFQRDHAFRSATKAAARRVIEHNVDRLGVDLRFYRGREDRLLEIVDLYDGELRSADAAIQSLFDAMGAWDRSRNAAWIVVGDHGEGLGDHRWHGHGKYIYEEQLRIPLILWFSDGRAKGVRVEEIAEQVDVLPTLAELSGEPALDPPTEGHSLLERLDGRIVEKTWAFAQRRAFEAPGPGSASNSNYDPGDRFALITPRFKYILWTEGDDELYDLSSDPHERENLAATGHPDERSLREALQRLIDHYRTRAAAAGEGVDAETKEQLRALGYTE